MAKKGKKRKFVMRKGFPILFALVLALFLVMIFLFFNFPPFWGFIAISVVVYLVIDYFTKAWIFKRL